MPFITDKLAANAEAVRQEKYNKQANRTSRFLFEPQKVMSLLRSRIVGQDAILDSIEDLLITVKADFGSKQNPLGVCLLLGPTGVGKTETVKVIAEAILGDAANICRIDMNTLAQGHYSAAITGAPPGYVGSKEGQTLFNIEAIQGSFSSPGIVLFDEIEKANRDVVRALLNILDTGKLRLSSGTKSIDFSNALIFMTSNIGAKAYSEELARYQSGWRRWLGLEPTQKATIIAQALSDHFDPEFINRIDRQLHFNTLNDHWFAALVDVEIIKLNQRLTKLNVSVSLESSVYAFLKLTYDNKYGARDVNRKIRTLIEPKLARALIDNKEKQRFIVKIENSSVIATPLYQENA